MTDILQYSDVRASPTLDMAGRKGRLRTSNDWLEEPERRQADALDRAPVMTVAGQRSDSY